VGTDPLLPAANACARPCQQLAELLGEGEGGIWQLPTFPVPLPALKRTLPPPLPMLQVGTGTEQELPVLVALGTIPPPCSQGIKSSGEVWRGQQSPPVFIGSPAVTAHLQCPTERSGCSVWGKEPPVTARAGGRRAALLLHHQLWKLGSRLMCQRLAL